MVKPIVNSFSTLAPILIQKYERYLPSAFDNSLSMLEKVNLVIEHLNQMGLITNDLIEQWNEITEWTLNEGLNESVRLKLDEMVTDGTFDTIINQNVFAALNSRIDGEAINIMYPPAPLVGAKADGTDQTAVIQAIIDHANSTGIRKVFVPSKKFSISNSLLLNGCSMEGVHVNLYNTTVRGSAFVALTTGFTAIKQGSLSANDIQFNVSNIMVLNATTGFEFIYVINSKFERLYAVDCVTGFKLGNSTSVGSMFCEFNHLWVTGATYGITIDSKDYFNNNIFKNGYIKASDYAMSIKVTGGYGAVGNVFNNVEFASALGRGILMSNTLNTVFNSCYFENGGNAIRLLDYNDISLNDCTFGVYKKTNTYGDLCFVYAVGGGRISVDGGIIFLTSENADTSFYDGLNADVYQNIDVKSTISINGTATNWKTWKQNPKQTAFKSEEQFKNSPTTVIPFGSYADITLVYDTPFSRIPDICIPILTGSNFEGSKLSFIRYENLATQCSVRVYNESTTTDRNVAVRVYAKTIVV